MAEIVGSLLQPMGIEESLTFHRRLIDHVTEGTGAIKVVHDVGDGKGKGLVACQAIHNGARILADAPLVCDVLCLRHPLPTSVLQVPLSMLCRC